MDFDEAMMQVEQIEQQKRAAMTELIQELQIDSSSNKLSKSKKRSISLIEAD